MIDGPVALTQAIIVTPRDQWQALLQRLPSLPCCPAQRRVLPWFKVSMSETSRVTAGSVSHAARPLPGQHVPACTGPYCQSGRLTNETLIPAGLNEGPRWLG
jgi:hypothetical protein